MSTSLNVNNLTSRLSAMYHVERGMSITSDDKFRVYARVLAGWTCCKCSTQVRVLQCQQARAGDHRRNHGQAPGTLSARGPTPLATNGAWAISCEYSRISPACCVGCSCAGMCYPQSA